MTAIPSPPDLFLLHGTPRQQNIVRDALARCDFPWPWLRVGLRADTGREQIPVGWEDLSRAHDSAAAERHVSARMHDVTDPATGEKAHVVEARGRVLGLAFYSGKVVLDTSLTGLPELAAEVFLSEAAHMVDFFWMADRHRVAIWNALHPQDQQIPADTAVTDGIDLGHGHGWFDVGAYRTFVGESWMGLFCLAFSDVAVTIEFADHPVTARAAKAVRAAMVPQETPPDPFVGARRSRVYHHPGCYIVPAILRPLDLGMVPPPDRRPCRLCRPDQPRGVRRGPEEDL